MSATSSGVGHLTRMADGTPLKLLHVLALIDHDKHAMRALLSGGSPRRTPDGKLTDLIIGLGQVATGIVTESKLFHEQLARIYGFAAGWLIYLGVGNPQNRIAAERDRQDELLRAGKFNYTCASPTADPERKLRILTEEVGEVAEALESLEQNNCLRRREHLIDELVQVAAVTVAWLESLEAPSGAAKAKAGKCTHGVWMNEYCQDCAKVMHPGPAQNPRRG